MAKEPDFIVFGSLKCGTTWMYNVLSKQDEVKLPYIKELNYFSEIDWGVNTSILGRLFGKHWRNKFFRNRSKYHFPYLWRNKDLANLIFYSLFCVTPRTLKFNFLFYKVLFPREYITGDITPSYMNLTDNTVKVIGKKLPKTLAYVLIRNPVDRLLSCFKMLKIKEKRSIDSFTEDEFIEYLNHPHTIAESDFGRIVRALRDGFENRLKIIIYDDIKNDPLRIVDGIKKDLGITSKNSQDLLEALDKKYNEGIKVEIPSWMYNLTVKNQMKYINDLDGIIDKSYIDKWKNEITIEQLKYGSNKNNS